MEANGEAGSAVGAGRGRARRPFDRRSIQAIVTNAFYSGRIAYEGELFDGRHPTIVAPEVFDAIQAQRPKRDRGVGHHEAGAPARRHLLSRLAVCADCGSPMFARTSPYKRKDGSKARSYACRSYVTADGTCSARPVDAEVVDTAVMERLADLLPDFAIWIGQIEDRHADERGRFARLVDEAERDRGRARADVDRHERRYRDLVARDDPHADLALEFVAGARRDLADAETRLEATRDALDSIPSEAPRNALLDFALDLREAIAGKVASSQSVSDVNRVLIEHF